MSGKCPILYFDRILIRIAILYRIKCISRCRRYIILKSYASKLCQNRSYESAKLDPALRLKWTKCWLNGGAHKMLHIFS